MKFPGLLTTYPEVSKLDRLLSKLHHEFFELHLTAQLDSEPASIGGFDGFGC